MSNAIPNEIAQGLAAWAERTPDATALWDGEQQITFAELEALAATHAARLLDRLRAHGLDQRGESAPRFGADGLPSAPIVPIVADRSAASIVALHAVWRAGVAAAPLDPALPAHTVAELCSRLGHPPVALVADGRDPAAAATLPPGVEALYVGTQVAHGAPAASDQRTPSARLGAVAGDGAGGGPGLEGHLEAGAIGGVVFTSGSTGVPKGVVVDWATVQQMHRFNTVHLTGGPTPGVKAMVAPVSYIAGFRLAMAPAAGAGLVLLDATRSTLAELLDAVDRAGVDLLASVASLVPALVEARAGRRLTHVTRAVVGAETVDWDHVAALRSIVAPDAEVVCGYGASEAPAGVTALVITPDQPLGEGPVPLGAPVADDRVRLVPVDDEPDAPLEIVVCGPVALGYLGDPERTARSFDVDPDGTRRWRTGDLADLGPDGLLHHRGRVDDMVKIRGMRVEPAAAETVLRAVPGVTAVAVVVGEAPDGDRRLVAHLAVDPAARLTPADARAALRSRLAPHHVPQVLVRHTTLPRTDRGKTDRAALAGLAVVPWRSGAVMAPDTAGERFLVATLATIVGLDATLVSVDDDVWDLGLDSLGAVELVTALADAGHGHVEVTALLDHPTARSLAAALATGDSTSGATHVAPGGITGTVAGDATAVLCPLGRGLGASTFRHLAEATGPGQPLVVLDDDHPGLDEWHGRHVVVLGYATGAPAALTLASRLTSFSANGVLQSAAVPLVLVTPSLDDDGWDVDLPVGVAVSVLDTPSRAKGLVAAARAAAGRDAVVVDLDAHPLTALRPPHLDVVTSHLRALDVAHRSG